MEILRNKCGDTVLLLPVYQLVSVINSSLNVKNKNGDTVAKAAYREEQGVAEFEVNEPGTYEIQTESQNQSVSSQGRKMYHWIFYTALAAVMAVIMGGTIVGVWRYRKRR